MPEPETIFIGVAWPYANGPLHLGHVAGVYLPADIFARYHRAHRDRVLMVSGSDQHGTPITVRAEQEGVSPADIAGRYHQDFLRSWAQFGISFDLYTHTSTDNHRRVVQDIFLKLLERDLIYRETMLSPYCPKEAKFLADRYVEGTCPICGYPGARGDQCDNCGHPLNPIDLIEPRCRFDGTRPEIRETEHFFFRLSAFTDRLKTWAEQQTQWKPGVRNFTLRWLEEGLKDRAVTRDIDWGIPVPVAGFEQKRIYVWFEAVIGYLSASIEWAEKIAHDPDAWKPFWHGHSRAYYFIGKDNIFFHTIMWPAILMGYEGLNLPYDVPANEFLTLEGQQFSTSRNWAVWLPDFLSRYDPDPLRYYLSINMPETGDADFSWREFVRRNNDELVATYGNLANRSLTLTYRNFDQRVPEPGHLDATDRALLDKSASMIAEVGAAIGLPSFRLALRQAMAVAQEANRYLDEKAPWKQIKQDRQAAATSLWITLNVLNRLKIALYPFLPFSSQKLHELLGFEGSVEAVGWTVQDVPAGQALATPEPLFKKLDEEQVIAAETGRLGSEGASQVA